MQRAVVIRLFHVAIRQSTLLRMGCAFMHVDGRCEMKPDERCPDSGSLEQGGRNSDRVGAKSEAAETHLKRDCRKLQNTSFVWRRRNKMQVVKITKERQ